MSIELIPLRRWRAVSLTIVAITLLSVACWPLVASASADQGLLIGAAILAAAKIFGDRRRDADEDAQGGHEATRFMLGAMNAGDFDGADEMVDADFRAYANGYPLMSDEVSAGPDLVRTMIGYWRDAIPDVRWELYDEVAEKQEDESVSLALRTVSRGTFDGEEHEIEVAVFGKIVDDRLTEWRMVVDMTVFNVFRMAIGLPPIE